MGGYYLKKVLTLVHQTDIIKIPKGDVIMDEKKTTNSERVKKCHEKNYGQLRVNVRNDKLDIWKQYAAYKGTSLYALVNQFFEEAIEKDNFIPEKTEE